MASPMDHPAGHQNISKVSKLEKTPVKIRGKRRFGRPDSPASRKYFVTASPNLRGNGERPFVRASIPHRATSKARRNHQVIPQKTLSRLESLPVELLEDILLWCLNASLPVASPILGLKLSSNHVKTKLLFNAFSVWNTDEQSKQSADAMKEQAELQSAVLRQKWFTMPFLRQHIPEYMTKTVVRELSSRKLHWLEKGPLVTKDLEPTIRTYMQSIFQNPQTPSYTELSWVSPTSNLPEDSHNVILGLGPQDGLVALHLNKTKPVPSPYSVSQHHRFRLLTCHPTTQIPPRLLHGPWDPDKTLLLEILIRGNASVDWLSTISGEVAKEGFLDAIHEHNARAVSALLTRLPDDYAATLTPGERKDAANGVQLPHSKGVGVTPETAHLVFAIEMGCNKGVVETLLNARESLIDPDHASVSAAVRAMDARGRGAERQKWVKGRIDFARWRRYGAGMAVGLKEKRMVEEAMGRHLGREMYYRNGVSYVGMTHS